MALSGGNEARASDVLALVATDSPTTFTTTTPAGSGWYRFLLGGALAEFYWTSSTTVAATTEAVPDITVPSAHRPGGRTALAATAGTTGCRPASAFIDPDGTFRVYNGHSAATNIAVHGIYKPA